MPNFEPTTRDRHGAAQPTASGPPLPLPMRPHGYPGVLITFCGIDGSGKTTMLEASARYLRAKGRHCFTTYTPTPRIRKNPLFRSLVDAANEEARGRVDVLGLGLQIMGDMLQHLKDTIIPELEQGRVVLCDRYLPTSQAEVRARGTDDEIEAIVHQLARRFIKPDLAVALDVSPGLAVRRVRAREAERDHPLDPAFIARQAEEYLAVARANHMLIVSSEQPMEVGFALLQRRIDGRLAERGW